jgi:hypothetical protein
MCQIKASPAESGIRYYGYYSPASRGISRGKRKMQEKDDAIPSILQPVEDPDLGGDGSSKEYRRNWARLIQKIYETDPLCCPKLVLAKAGIPGPDEGDIGHRTA